MPILARRAVLLAALLASLPAMADSTQRSPLAPLLDLAGLARADIAPDPVRLDASPTRERQLAMVRAILADPLQAASRAGLLADDFRAAISSPAQLFVRAGALAGLTASSSGACPSRRLESELRQAADPLAKALAWMAPLAGPDQPGLTELPDEARLPTPLRFELALVLATVGQSHECLQRALARLPASLSPALLLTRSREGPVGTREDTDYRQWLPAVDREVLLDGMRELVEAVQRLRNYVVKTPKLPAVQWRGDTPLGQIVVDTTARDNVHRLKDALLVLDVGGDDRYEFQARSDSNRISILLDHGGNDVYVTEFPGGDASAAVLGYGILWDTAGDDQYRGTQFAQGAALFGASLLVDEGGRNDFVADGHAQAHAIGGVAILVGGPGDDRYTAATQAQGSAGPGGIAVLIDRAGNDGYALLNVPHIAPSPQLPLHNTSLGQGAGYGIRADADGTRASAGGIGMLLDLAGDDTYRAQVFAQGAGYYEGLGLLVDEGGSDRFDAAWYAMGAAAHRGAGVFLKRGNGNDRYRATHFTSIAAAHDFSVAVFVDEGGDDHYRLGDLGLGAANDYGIALFADAAGHDTYVVDAPGCRAFGSSHLDEGGALEGNLPNVGLFMDLGGDDAYPVHCARARNNAIWPGLRAKPQVKGRSEAGAGIDGTFLLPFATGPRDARGSRP